MKILTKLLRANIHCCSLDILSPLPHNIKWLVPYFYIIYTCTLIIWYHQEKQSTKYIAFKNSKKEKQGKISIKCALKECLSVTLLLVLMLSNMEFSGAR